MRTLAIYGAYFAQFLKARMAYRADFFAEVFATGLGSAASLAFVFVLFVPIDAIAGWSRDEILFVYGMSMIPYGLFATVSWNLFDFGDRFVIEGHFDRVLLRPVNSFAQVVFEAFRIQTLTESAIGVVVVATAARRLDLDLGILDFAWMGVAVLSGCAIFVAVFGTIASLSFHFEDRVGIAPPVFNLINAGRYPVDLFPQAVRFVLRWIIPFAFVAFYPSALPLHKDELRSFCMATPLVALVFLGVLAFAWKRGVRSYQSTGS